MTTKKHPLHVELIKESIMKRGNAIKTRKEAIIAIIASCMSIAWRGVGRSMGTLRIIDPTLGRRMKLTKPTQPKHKMKKEMLSPN